MGGKALRHTAVMSRGCTCTLSRLTSLETGDRLLPYGSGTLHLPGLEIARPETRLKDYLPPFSQISSDTRISIVTPLVFIFYIMFADIYRNLYEVKS